MRTMCRDRPRGCLTTTSSPHSSRDCCQGRVTRAGSGFVATMRSAMATSVVPAHRPGSGPRAPPGLGCGSAPRLEEDRSRPPARGPVVAVVQGAGAQAQAAAADAAVELVAEPLETFDLGIDARPPAAGEPCPVRARGRPAFRQRGQRLGDLLQAQADPLRGPDEGHPAQGGAGIAALVPAGPLGMDQALVLVVAQGRGGDPRPGGDLTDRQGSNGHDTNNTSTSLEVEDAYDRARAGAKPRLPARAIERGGVGPGNRTDPSGRATGVARDYFLKASLTFSPACLMSALLWSPLPSAWRSLLSVASPSVSLALPSMPSPLLASLSSLPM